MVGKYPHPGALNYWQMPDRGAVIASLIPTPSPASPPGGLTLIGASDQEAIKI